MFAGIALTVIVLAALAIVAVVAVSSGHIRIKDQRIQRIAVAANERLNGKGQVPGFLRRLDDRGARR